MTIEINCVSVSVACRVMLCNGVSSYVVYRIVSAFGTPSRAMILTSIVASSEYALPSYAFIPIDTSSSEFMSGHQTSR